MIFHTKLKRKKWLICVSYVYILNLYSYIHLSIDKVCVSQTVFGTKYFVFLLKVLQKMVYGLAFL